MAIPEKMIDETVNRASVILQTQIAEAGQLEHDDWDVVLIAVAKQDEKIEIFAAMNCPIELARGIAMHFALEQDMKMSVDTSSELPKN